MPVSRVRELLVQLDTRTMIRVVGRSTVAPTVDPLPIPERYKHVFDENWELLWSPGQRVFGGVWEPCTLDFSAVAYAPAADKARLLRDVLVEAYPTCGCSADVSDWLWMVQLKFVDQPVLGSHALALRRGVPEGPDQPWSEFVGGLVGGEATLTVGEPQLSPGALLDLERALRLHAEPPR